MKFFKKTTIIFILLNLLSFSFTETVTSTGLLNSEKIHSKHRHKNKLRAYRGQGGTIENQGNTQTEQNNVDIKGSTEKETKTTEDSTIFDTWVRYFHVEKGKPTNQFFTNPDYNGGNFNNTPIKGTELEVLKKERVVFI